MNVCFINYISYFVIWIDIVNIVWNAKPIYYILFILLLLFVCDYYWNYVYIYDYTYVYDNAN